jgi:hypothetical protein
MLIIQSPVRRSAPAIRLLSAPSRFSQSQSEMLCAAFDRRQPDLVGRLAIPNFASVGLASGGILVRVSRLGGILSCRRGRIKPTRTNHPRSVLWRCAERDSAADFFLAESASPLPPTERSSDEDRLGHKGPQPQVRIEAGAVVTSAHCR